MTKPYFPKGKTGDFVRAVQANPERIWALQEIAAFMGQTCKKLGGTLTYPLSYGLIHRGKIGRNVFVKGTPFPSDMAYVLRKGEDPIEPANGYRAWEASRDDPRCQKIVPGWLPPKMVCVRTSV